jgi:hypothetical protein
MNFYHIQSKDNLNRVAYLKTNLKYELLCEIADGKERVHEPMRVNHLSGKKWPDFLTQSEVVLPFFSEKLVQILEQNGFSGWGKFEIEIENRPSEIETKYFGIFITGRCDNNLKIIEKENCLKNWDGSDIFKMEGTSTIFITERVKMVLTEKKLKLSNIYIEDLDDYILGKKDYKAYMAKRWGF